jgi:hypothetical protein
VAKRYQPQALLGEQGGVQTFSGRDALNGLPVRMYTFMGEPTAKVGELVSPYIPPVLSSSFSGGAGEVITAFSPEFRALKGTVAPAQVEALLRQSAAALDDAAQAGVVHGDLSPERVLFDREGGVGGRFLLEGYGVPWRVRPSEFSAPERIGGASFAADIFSWARTVKHLSGPLPGDLRDLLDRCLSADPKARPQAREVRAALERYPFREGAPSKGAGSQSARDTSAFDRFDDAQGEPDDFLTAPLPDLYEATAASPETPNGTPAETSVETPVEPVRATGPRVSVQPATAEPAEPAPAAAPEARRPVTFTVRSAPAETRRLPVDALRQIDQTAAYEARRARYRAQQGFGDDSPAEGEAAVEAPSAQAPVRVRPARTWGDVPNPGAAREGAHTADDLEDFEVVDDIDDRAPDPTLNRGGRRVLLLTLLSIAILVLIALQFV